MIIIRDCENIYSKLRINCKSWSGALQADINEQLTDPHDILDNIEARATDESNDMRSN